eukprot:gene8364-13900_t
MRFSTNFISRSVALLAAIMVMGTQSSHVDIYAACCDDDSCDDYEDECVDPTGVAPISFEFKPIVSAGVSGPPSLLCPNICDALNNLTPDGTPEITCDEDTGPQGGQLRMLLTNGEFDCPAIVEALNNLTPSGTEELVCVDRGSYSKFGTADDSEASNGEAACALTRLYHPTYGFGGTRDSTALEITLAAGLNVATLSKADFDTVAAKYQASAAAAAGIAVDKIERVEFYVDGTLIQTPTQRRDRRAEGEVTMKIIFKESYTEAEAKTAAASFNAAVAAGTVGKVTVVLADGQSYETTFESVEIVVDNKSGILPGSNSAEGLCTTVGVIVATVVWRYTPVFTSALLSRACSLVSPPNRKNRPRMNTGATSTTTTTAVLQCESGFITVDGVCVSL